VSLQQLRENKMKWIKWVTVVLIILWGLNEELESQGFCIKKMAFLSDLYTEQELIDQAIAYKIQRIPSAIGWRGEGKGKDIKPIYGLNAFIMDDSITATTNPKKLKAGTTLFLKGVTLKEYKEVEQRLIAAQQAKEDKKKNS